MHKPRTDHTFRLLCIVIVLSALGQACFFYLALSRRPTHGSGFVLAEALDPHQAAEAARQEHASMLAEAARIPPAVRAQLSAALAQPAGLQLAPEAHAAAWRLAALERLQPQQHPATPALRPWLVYFATPWFGLRTHKWAEEERLHACPSGCAIAFYSAAHKPLWHRADLALYFPGPGAGERLSPPPPHAATAASNSSTVHALFYAENFAPAFSAAHVGKYDAQVSYRQGGLWQDTEYMLSALGSAGLAAAAAAPSPQRPEFAALRWTDLVAQPPMQPLPRLPRLSLASGARSIVSWSTTHCSSRSGREELVAALELLSTAPLAVDIFGRGSCCLCAPWRHAGPAAQPALLAESAAGPPFPLQEALLPRYKFHLAMENSLCQDYVTEKAYAALARGVVPVLLSAPNARAYLPPRSYVNVRDFSSVSALAAHLRALDANASAYAAYGAWRSVPFGKWAEGEGGEFKRVLQSLLPWATAGQGGKRRLGAGVEAEAPTPAAGSPREWYTCGLCDALDAAAAAGAGSGGAAAGPSPPVFPSAQARSAALWRALAAAQGRAGSSSSSAAQGPAACQPAMHVADDAVGTLTFPTASEYQPPHRPTHLPWLTRALAARDEEKAALVRDKRRKRAAGEVV